MNCFAVAGVIDLHREGRLSPSRAKEVQSHLDACAVCAATLGPAAPEPGTRAPSVKAPSFLKDRLRKAAVAPPASAATASRRPSPALFALAASLALLSLLHLALRDRPGSQREGAPAEFSVRRLP